MIEGALLSKPVFSRNGVFFWLLRCLVRVRYSFFLVSVLLALRSRSVTRILVWVVVVFVAILLHELGHALMARYYRQTPRIELHAMGGETTWTWVSEPKRFQTVYISLAGPGIGFLAGGLLWLAGWVIPPQEPYVLTLARYDFLWVTLAWGLFNLLPIFPLDGAHIAGELMERGMGRGRGRLMARQLSVATALICLGAALVADQTWVALLCGVLAFDNYQRMRGMPGVAMPR